MVYQFSSIISCTVYCISLLLIFIYSPAGQRHLEAFSRCTLRIRLRKQLSDELKFLSALGPLAAKVQEPVFQRFGRSKRPF